MRDERLYVQQTKHCRVRDGFDRVLMCRNSERSGEKSVGGVDGIGSGPVGDSEEACAARVLMMMPIAIFMKVSVRLQSAWSYYWG